MPRTASSALFFYALLGVWQSTVDWLEAHLLKCPIKQTLFIDCPGCGLQRSFVALLRGDFAGSWQWYPATMPMVFLLGFTVLHLKMNFRWGALFIKFLYIAIASTIVVNYIVKIKTHQLF